MNTLTINKQQHTTGDLSEFTGQNGTIKPGSRVRWAAYREGDDPPRFNRPATVQNIWHANDEFGVVTKVKFDPDPADTKIGTRNGWESFVPAKDLKPI